MKKTGYFFVNNLGQTEVKPCNLHKNKQNK